MPPPPTKNNNRQTFIVIGVALAVVVVIAIVGTIFDESTDTAESSKPSATTTSPIATTRTEPNSSSKGPTSSPSITSSPKPLDCRASVIERFTDDFRLHTPTEYERTDNYWDGTVYFRTRVEVKIRNLTPHKMRVQGVEFATSWTGSDGVRRSTLELHGIFKYDYVPELGPSWPAIDRDEKLVRGGKTVTFSRNFTKSIVAVVNAYDTDGNRPVATDIGIEWHFDNPDLIEACERAGQATPPGT